MKTCESGAWLPEQIATLRRMWAAGISARKIAPHVGRSRNAVIGKSRRLGLEARRPSPILPTGLGEGRAAHRARWNGLRRERRAADAAAGVAPKPRARPRPAAFAAPVVAAQPPRIAYMPRNTPPITSARCQFIAGEPPKPWLDDAIKCMAPSVGGAYCHAHLELVFILRKPAPGNSVPHDHKEV